ncbi:MULTISPECIES: hypothetical protein [unclassified Leifsonia]|uniref:hypothetical protein n=1 Tax=unclassified Leifsonia TaxID=2663824 RepID=UPI000A9CE7E2|nr:MULTISPECIES: hypothetical protein [unclassified Leifsonia]
MSEEVAVDTGQLRAAAQVLAQASDPRRMSGVEASYLGSAVAADAFERFEEYWPPARSLLTSSVDAMKRALIAAADGYERRDTEDAQQFQRGIRAV